MVKNLKIFDLILTSKFEVFWGLSSKNLDISNLNYPQNLILNLNKTEYHSVQTDGQNYDFK